MNIDLEKKLKFHSKYEDNIQEIINMIKEKRVENNSKHFVIDKIEDDIAVCENLKNGNILNIKLNNLPKGINESQIITLENGKYIEDKNVYKDRNKYIRDITKNLWVN